MYRAQTMSTPARRPGNRPSRRKREARAYRLTLATGGFGLATLVVLVLSIVGVASFGLAVLLAVITAVLAWATKRTVS
jgi:hypothetical protein